MKYINNTAFWGFFQLSLLLPIFWLDRTPKQSDMDIPVFKGSM